MPFNTKKAVATAVEAVEVAGTSLGLGFVEGRYGEQKTTFFMKKDETTGQVKSGSGVPLALLTAVAGYGLALSGVVDGYEEHVTNVASGALAYYAGGQGVQMGLKAARKADSAAPDASPGHRVDALPYGGARFDAYGNPILSAARR